MIRGFLRTALFGCLACAALTARADCPATSIDPADALTDASVGSSYSQIFSASGSAALPYGYQVTSGLPAGIGLSMNAATGELSGSPTQVGTLLLTITATDADGCNGGRTYALSIVPGDQTITFSSTAPLNASNGGPTYDVSATATSGLPVTFTIDASATSVCTIAGSTVSFIGNGTCVIDANQAGDSNWNAAPQAQQSFDVGKTAQTISYSSTAPADAVVGGPTYDVSATASSGLTVAFTIDAPAASVCSIAGSTVSFTGFGTCVIDANQAGDSTYAPAPQAQQSFSVGKGSQTISITSTAPVGAKVGGTTYTVTASATSGLTVTFTIDAAATSVCSISGDTVSFLAVGTCTIDANQAGDASYAAAPQVQQGFAVGKGDQTITFSSTAPVGAKVNDAPYNVTATSTSGLTVTFTIDGAAASVCSLSGSSVSFIAGGTCVIDANQVGDSNYNAATQAQQSFTVVKLDQTISFSSTPVSPKNAGPTYTVSATGGGSGNPVTFTIDASASTVCSIAGSTVSFIGAGNCVIDADQAGNAQYNAATQAQQSFLVAKGDQTINVSSTAPAFGSATAAGSPHTYTVTATATSGLTVAISGNGACSASGNVVTFGPGAGDCTIDANQAGDTNWNPAPQVQQSTTVEIPVSATGDGHAATGNVAIAPATSVTANDSGTSLVLTSYGATTGAEQASFGTATPTAQGGSVTMAADGTYAFVPKANFNGTDTFKYVIANHVSTATGTVTLTVADRIMVVTTAGGGSCIPASPCTLGTADAAASVSPNIDLVYVESGTYPAATISLNSNQKLVGQIVDLNTAIGDAGITLAAESVAPANISASARPVFNNSTNVITLAGSNLVEYFNINPTGGSAILGNAIAASTNNLHDLTITGTGTAIGVNLTNNTGSTFNFSNIGVSTASGGAFVATGGGTVNATQDNVTVVNTLASGTGTALTVTSTTIGASGLTFRSIAANAAVDGIALSSTGTGALTVTGNSAVGSGGVIQNTTAAGITTTTTGSISLSWMTIQNSGTKGILVTGATGFTLDHSTVVDNAGGATDEGVNLINVGGNVTISNDTIDSAPHNQIFIDNNNTNMAALSVTNSTIKCTAGNVCQPAGSVGNDGLLVQIRGTSVLTTGNVQNCTFSGLRATGVQVTGGDTAVIGSSSGGAISNSLVVQTSTFQDSNIGIDISKAQSSSVTFQVLNNPTMTGQHSHAINTATSAGSGFGGSMTGNITGNVIGTQTVKDSGSAIGNGIRVVLQGDTTQGFYTIANNTIREIANADTILLISQNGRGVPNTGGARFNVSNNTLPQPSGTTQSIGCGAGVPCMPEGPVFLLADEDTPTCALISSNTIFDATSMNAAADVYLAERTGPPTGAVVKIQGSGGAVAFVNANNTLNGVSKTFDEDGGAITTASCGTFPP